MDPYVVKLQSYIRGELARRSLSAFNREARRQIAGVKDTFRDIDVEDAFFDELQYIKDKEAAERQRIQQAQQAAEILKLQENSVQRLQAFIRGEMGRRKKAAESPIVRRQIIANTNPVYRDSFREMLPVDDPFIIELQKQEQNYNDALEPIEKDNIIEENKEVPAPENKPSEEMLQVQQNQEKTIPQKQDNLTTTTELKPPKIDQQETEIRVNKIDDTEPQINDLLSNPMHKQEVNTPQEEIKVQETLKQSQQHEQPNDQLTSQPVLDTKQQNDEQQPLKTNQNVDIFVEESKLQFFTIIKPLTKAYQQTKTISGSYVQLQRPLIQRKQIDAQKKLFNLQNKVRVNLLSCMRIVKKFSIGNKITKIYTLTNTSKQYYEIQIKPHSQECFILYNQIGQTTPKQDNETPQPDITAQEEVKQSQKSEQNTSKIDSQQIINDVNQMNAQPKLKAQQNPIKILNEQKLQFESLQKPWIKILKISKTTQEFYIYSKPKQQIYVANKIQKHFQGIIKPSTKEPIFVTSQQNLQLQDTPQEINQDVISSIESQANQPARKTEASKQIKPTDKINVIEPIEPPEQMKQPQQTITSQNTQQSTLQASQQIKPIEKINVTEPIEPPQQMKQPQQPITSQSTQQSNSQASQQTKPTDKINVTEPIEHPELIKQPQETVTSQNTQQSTLQASQGIEPAQKINVREPIQLPEQMKQPQQAIQSQNTQQSTLQASQGIEPTQKINVTDLQTSNSQQIKPTEQVSLTDSIQPPEQAKQPQQTRPQQKHQQSPKHKKSPQKSKPIQQKKAPQQTKKAQQNKPRQQSISAQQTKSPERTKATQQSQQTKQNSPPRQTIPSPENMIQPKQLRQHEIKSLEQTDANQLIQTPVQPEQTHITQQIQPSQPTYAVKQIYPEQAHAPQQIQQPENVHKTDQIKTPEKKLVTDQIEPPKQTKKVEHSKPPEQIQQVDQIEAPKQTNQNEDSKLPQQAQLAEQIQPLKQTDAIKQEQLEQTHKPQQVQQPENEHKTGQIMLPDRNQLTDQIEPPKQTNKNEHGGPPEQIQQAGQIEPLQQTSITNQIQPPEQKNAAALTQPLELVKPPEQIQTTDNNHIKESEPNKTVQQNQPVKENQIVQQNITPRNKQIKQKIPADSKNVAQPKKLAESNKTNEEISRKVDIPIQHIPTNQPNQTQQAVINHPVAARNQASPASAKTKNSAKQQMPSKQENSISQTPTIKQNRKKQANQQRPKSKRPNSKLSNIATDKPQVQSQSAAINIPKQQNLPKAQIESQSSIVSIAEPTVKQDLAQISQKTRPNLQIASVDSQIPAPNTQLKKPQIQIQSQSSGVSIPDPISRLTSSESILQIQPPKIQASTEQNIKPQSVTASEQKIKPQSVTAPQQKINPKAVQQSIQPTKDFHKQPRQSNSPNRRKYPKLRRRNNNRSGDSDSSLSNTSHISLNSSPSRGNIDSRFHQRPNLTSSSPRRQAFPTFRSTRALQKKSPTSARLRQTRLSLPSARSTSSTRKSTSPKLQRKRFNKTKKSNGQYRQKNRPNIMISTTPALTSGPMSASQPFLLNSPKPPSQQWYKGNNITAVRSPRTTRILQHATAAELINKRSPISSSPAFTTSRNRNNIKKARLPSLPSNRPAGKGMVDSFNPKYFTTQKRRNSKNSKQYSNSDITELFQQTINAANAQQLPEGVLNVYQENGVVIIAAKPNNLQQGDQILPRKTKFFKKVFNNDHLQRQSLNTTPEKSFKNLASTQQKKLLKNNSAPSFHRSAPTIAASEQAIKTKSGKSPYEMQTSREQFKGQQRAEIIAEKPGSYSRKYKQAQISFNYYNQYEQLVNM